MTPSASTATASSTPSVTTQQQQSSNSASLTPTPNGAATTNGININPALRRPKKEINLFHKNPSKPFALQAMRAKNGMGTSTGSSGTGSTTNQMNANAASSRASPIPKSQSAGTGTGSSTPEQQASPRPSGASTPSNSQGSLSASASASASTPSNAAATASTTEPPSQPEVGYQDFRIVSTDRHGWKYDVMKFDSRKPIDINLWARPIKLNRKEIKRSDTAGSEGGPTPVAPMLGSDGKPVIGADGRIVMVSADGRPIHDSKAAGGGASANNAKNGKDDKNNNKKKKFQKKTRQVFLVPDHIRQLRKEERYPWVMEDASGKEVWEGRMEEATKAELYALFMPAPDSLFRFVPANRWYKFQKRRPQQQTWSLEEAEKMMAKMQKNRDGERWLMRKRNNNGEAGAARTPGGLGGPSLVYDIGGMSLGPGGRRLRTVDAGMRGLFEEDDEEGMQDRRRRARERDFEGDADEVEYEEDFADDEEKMEPDDIAADEEAKELEERLKREYRQANKTHEGYVDDTDEEEDADNLTGTGKDIKKLVRKIEKNAAYESDEDKNPYASSEEEEEEETPTPMPSGPAVQDQSSSASRAQSKPGSRPSSKPPSRPSSRSGSPAPPGSGGTTNAKIKSETPGSPPPPPPPTSPALGMGGHSVLAKRATSPKAPTFSKIKGQQPGGGGVASRATSPLAAGGSRATSPAPVSPGVASPSKKRKADGDVPTSPVSGVTPGGGGGGGGAGGNAVGKHKKRKPTASTIASISSPFITSPLSPTGIKTESSPSPSTSVSTSTSKPPPTPAPQVAPSTELTTALLVSWLRASPGATTRECIHYFQPALTDDGKKARFTALVKEVASLKNGVLALKAQYRDAAGEDVKA